MVKKNVDFWMFFGFVVRGYFCDDVLICFMFVIMFVNYYSFVFVYVGGLLFGIWILYLDRISWMLYI